MDRTMTFFRVFDLAFFAPGAVIVLFVFLGYGPPAAALRSGGGVVASIFPMTALILCSYVVGIAVFSLRWWSRELRSRFRVARNPGKISVDPSIVHLLELYPRRQELLLYFWYLRATCWNVGMALFLCALAASIARPRWVPESRDFLAFSALFLLASLITRQGDGYHRTLQEAANKPTDPEDGSDR